MSRVWVYTIEREKGRRREEGRKEGGMGTCKRVTNTILKSLVFIDNIMYGDHL